MKPFLRYYLPALLWAALVFTLSSVPRLTPPPVGFKLSDKIYHFIEFAIFGLLLIRALGYRYSPAMRSVALRRVILLGVLWGALDEFHQMFVAGRDASLQDVLADAVGVIAVAAAAYWWRRKKNSSENTSAERTA